MKDKTKYRAAPSRPAKPASREAAQADGKRRFRSPFRLPAVSGMQGAQGRTRRFFRDTKSELKKVVWPTRQEAINLTMIVIAVSVAMGILLGGIDYLFKIVFELLVTGV